MKLRVTIGLASLGVQALLLDRLAGRNVNW